METDPASLAQDLPHDAERILTELEVRISASGKRKPPEEVVWHGRSGLVLRSPELPGLILKRLPPFSSDDRRALYARGVDAYAQLLQDPIGLTVLPHVCMKIDGEAGPVLFILQSEVEASSIGHRLIHDIDDVSFTWALQAVLRESLRVWHRNAIEREIQGHDSQIGLDARLSNWSIELTGDQPQATYFDTGTPFIRRLGKDRVDPQIFPDHIPSAPTSFWSRRKPEEELGRYYELRTVCIDLLAEVGAVAPNRLDSALRQVNAFLEGEAEDLGEQQIDEEELKKPLKIEKKRWEETVR